MENEKWNLEFWTACESLVASSNIFVEHKAGTTHNKYNDFIYPTDYGYICNTISSDSDCIDIWVGSSNSNAICGCIVTIDLLKRDSEIKLLYSSFAS